MSLRLLVEEGPDGIVEYVEVLARVSELGVGIVMPLTSGFTEIWSVGRSYRAGEHARKCAVSLTHPFERAAPKRRSNAALCGPKVDKAPVVKAYDS